MAINKNFVIKNGVEVNTDLLVGDSTLNKVGIATTVPGYTLHIGVGAGARGGIGATDLTVTGVATIGTQNSTSGALNVGGISTFSGDIFVGSGATIQANGNVAFAGIGTIGGDLNVGGNLNAGDITIDEITARNINVTGFATFTAIGGNLIPDSDGTHNIGAAGSEWQDLFIDGTAKIDALEADTAKIGDLTDNRVVIAGSSGELEDSGNLTFDGTTLAVTGQETVSVDVTVGTGVTLQRHGGVSIAGITTVGGNLLAGGDILPDADGSRDLGSSAKEFQDLFIDGTANIDTLAADTAAIADLTDNRVVIAGSGGELEDSGNLTFNGSTLAVTGDETVSGKITVGTGASIHASTGNAAFAGIVTANGGIRVGTAITIQPHGGVSIAGIVTVGGDLNVQGDIVYDEITGRNLNITGISTFAGKVNVNGDIDLGNATSDTITATGRFDSDLVPSTDGARDLGTSDLEWQDLFIDGTANIDSLSADTAIIGDLTDNRVVIAGSGGELEDSGNLTFDGSTLAITGSIDLSADIDVDGVANLDNIDVDGTANFADDVTLVAAGSSTILFDASAFDLTFQDNIRAKFGTGKDLTVFHNGTDSRIENTTNQLILKSPTITFQDSGNRNQLIARNNAEIELYYGGTQKLETSADGILVGSLSTVQTNGNAAFAGITTVGTALSLTDNVKAQFGAGGDLAVYHNGTDSYIENTTNDLHLKTSGSGDDIILTAKDDINLKTNQGDNAVVVQGGGGVSLYYNAGLRFQTDGIGINVGSAATLQTNGNAAFAGITTIGGALDANSTSNFADDVTLVASIGAGSSTILFDSSAGTVIFQDNIRANFGTGEDLSIYHNGTDSYIQDKGTGSLKLLTAASGSVTIEEADANLALFTADTGVTLYDGGNNARVTTNTDGVDIGGTGSIRVPNGTTAQRNSSPASGDFRYNTTTGKFEGYTDEWGDIGGSGGVSETDTSVSSTSATSCGSFAKASFRSASIIAQITQGSNYQVGRYLLIHDGTTVTTIEESAVATGSMLGTFEGVINSSNVEFRVTMGSSSSATVTTKIDTVTV